MFLEEFEVNLTIEKYQWSHLPYRMALKPRRYPNVMRCTRYCRQHERCLGKV